MDLQKMIIDPSKQREGVWVNFDHETRFKIASTANDSYADAFEKKMRQYRTQLRREEMPRSELTRISSEVLADSVLLGWEGLKNGNSDYPFNRENAIHLLVNVPDVREFITRQAADLDNFRQQQLKESVENLKKS